MRVESVLNKMFGWKVKSELDYSCLCRQGLPADAFVKLQDFGFKQGELNWIMTNQALTKCIGNSGRLTADQSAKVIRVARLMVIAFQVFGSRSKALNWMSKSKIRLGKRTPKEAMMDEFGAHDVESILMQLDNGYY